MVVQLLGLYESSLQSVLVTEYLSGGDLVTRYMIVYGHRIPFRRRPCYKVYDSYGHIIPFRRRPCYKVNDSLWSQNTFQEETLLQGI